MKIHLTSTLATLAAKEHLKHRHLMGGLGDGILRSHLDNKNNNNDRNNHNRNAIIDIIMDHPATRALQASDICVNETEAIAEDPAFVTLLEEFESQLDSIDFDTVCDITGTTFRCIFDRADFSALNNVEQLCDDAGGQNLVLDNGVRCDITEGNDDFVVIYGFRDFPECIGPSCVEENLEDELDEFFTLLAEDLGPALRAEGFDTATCRVSDDFSAPSFGIKPSLSTSLWTLMGAASAMAASWLVL